MHCSLSISTHSLFADLCECGINMLLFCNVSLRLTSDFSHVNNETDDPHVQGIEETRWHMAAHRVDTQHLEILTLFLFLSPPHPPHHRLLTKNLLFNLPIWSLLTGVTLPFQYPVIHHVSITNTLGQGKNSALGNGWIKQQVLRGRWSTLASGCSSQLLSDLEYIKKLGDPQLLGFCTVKKEKNPSLCFMNNENIGLQPLKYTEGSLCLLLVFHIVCLVLLPVISSSYFNPPLHLFSLI